MSTEKIKPKKSKRKTMTAKDIPIVGDGNIKETIEDEKAREIKEKRESFLNLVDDFRKRNTNHDARINDLNPNQTVQNVKEWKAYLSILKTLFLVYELRITTNKRKMKSVKDEIDRVFVSDPLRGIQEEKTLFDLLGKDGIDNTIELTIDLNDGYQAYSDLMVEAKKQLGREDFIEFVKSFHSASQSAGEEAKKIHGDND